MERIVSDYKYFQKNNRIIAHLGGNTYIRNPLALVERLVKKANIDWTDGTLKLFFPYASDGIIPMYCVNKLLKAGHSRQHICENMIYIHEENSNRCNFIKSLLSENNTYKTNVECYDLLCSNKDNRNRGFKDMKFSYGIMNPPYAKTLHLDILCKVMEQVDTVVNLSPIGWLQDPTCEYKGKRCPFGRYKDKFIGHIDSIESIGRGIEYFDAHNHQRLGIYHIKKDKGTFNIESLYKDTFIESYCNRAINDGSLNSLIKPLSKDGKYYVPTSRIMGGSGNRFKKKTDLFSSNGAIQRIIVKDMMNINTGEVCLKKEGFCFDTEIDARNFIEKTKTNIFLFLLLKTKVGVHTNFSLLPDIDYTKEPPISDEELLMFMKTFNDTE